MIVIFHGFGMKKKYTVLDGPNNLERWPKGNGYQEHHIPLYTSLDN